MTLTDLQFVNEGNMDGVGNLRVRFRDFLEEFFYVIFQKWQMLYKIANDALLYQQTPYTFPANEVLANALLVFY
jgi:hypothetical protein